jgi:hypothetical protein
VKRVPENNDPGGSNAPRVRLSVLFAVFMIPFAVRLAAMLAIPIEADADGYSHALFTENMAVKMRSGGFRLADLHGFWLPLYHVTGAMMSLVFESTFWCCRMVSVLAGAATCAFVWGVAFRVFRSRVAAWGAWLLIVTAPWHILYSAFAMTEATFGLCIAASVYFLVRSNRENRFFIPAAIAVGASCLLRYEGWVMAPVILLVAAGQRRTRFWTLVTGGVIMAAPVVGWHFLNHVVTGNAFWHLGFQKSNMAEYNALHPGLALRSAYNMVKHVGLLGLTAGPAAFVLGFMGLWIVLRDRALRREAFPLWLVAAVQILFTVYSYVAGDSGSFARYWVPVAWGMAALGGLAVARLANPFWHSAAGWGKPAAIAGIVIAACGNLFIFGLSAYWTFRQAEATVQVSSELKKHRRTVRDLPERPAARMFYRPVRDAEGPGKGARFSSRAERRVHGLAGRRVCGIALRISGAGRRKANAGIRPLRKSEGEREETQDGVAGNIPVQGHFEMRRTTLSGKPRMGSALPSPFMSE